MASKTGTVSKNKKLNGDSWNISFCDKYTVAVWHGDSTETGGGHPTRHTYNIWKNLYETGEKYDFQNGFKRPKSIINLPIDTYSTNRLNRVTVATDNTPRKYVKNEFFKQSNKVDFENSLFENYSVNFEISVKDADKTVEINFKTEDIYTYYIVRTDTLGSKTISTVDGNGNSITLRDKPVFLPFPVQYEIMACVKGKTPNDHIVGTCKKTVII